MEPTSPFLAESTQLKTIQVASTTPPRPLAGSITEEVRQAIESVPQRVPNISLHAIGHQAIGQAIKSIPIANGFLGSKGLVLLVLPTFEDRTVADEDDATKTVVRTVMRMKLVLWRLGG